MAQAVYFDGHNKVLMPPLGADGEARQDVQALHVFNNGVVSASKWLLNCDELEEVTRTGCVMLSVMAGETAPPVYVGSETSVRALVADTGAVWAKDQPDDDPDAEAGYGESQTVQSFDLVKHLHRQRQFSQKTFGPGARTDGVLDHITKEIEELRASPNDLEEWVDLILLSLDGAWRAGYSPEVIAKGIELKQGINEKRDWPHWKDMDASKAIEHRRGV